MTTIPAILAAVVGVLLLGVCLGIPLGRKPTETAPKSKPKVSNIVLALLGAFVFVFSVAMVVIFCVKGAVPDTLIQYTLGAGGVEAVALSAIKIAKTCKGGNCDG